MGKEGVLSNMLITGTGFRENCCAAALLALLFVFGVIFRWKVMAALFGVLFVLTVLFTLYMKKCSDLFDI